MEIKNMIKTQKRYSQMEFESEMDMYLVSDFIWNLKFAIQI